MIRSEEVGTQIKANIITISGLSMVYGMSIDFKECEELMDRIVVLKKETFDLVDRLSKGEANNGKEGRPKKFTKQQIEHVLELLESHSYTQVEQMSGISKSTLIRAKKKSKVAL